MLSGRFEPGGPSLEGRQFALTMDEAIAYADRDLSKVAILRATVKASALDTIDFSTTIDPFIFRNGVYTVQPGAQSEAFHAGLLGISHVF
jgi:filamentous hemagglutinin